MIGTDAVAAACTALAHDLRDLGEEPGRWLVGAAESRLIPLRKAADFAEDWLR